MVLFPATSPTIMRSLLALLLFRGAFEVLAIAMPLPNATSTLQFTTVVRPGCDTMSTSTLVPTSATTHIIIDTSTTATSSLLSIFVFDATPTTSSLS